MKRPVFKLITLVASCATLMSFILQSCSDDSEPEVDKEPPAIVISNPTGTENFLKGTINITSSATDNVEVVSLALYVDNVQLATSQENTLNVPLDTKTLTDGQHVIKVVAVDAKENQNEISRNINILNYVVKFNFVNPDVTGNNAQWYVLTRGDGSLVGYGQYEQGMSNLYFETPDDYEEGEEFTLTSISHFEWNSGYVINSLGVMPGYVAGQYSLSPVLNTGNGVNNPGPGTHTVNISNVATNVSSKYNGDYNSIYIDYIDNGYSLTLGLAKNDARFYVAFQDDYANMPVFDFKTGLNAGGTTNLDYNSFQSLSGLNINYSDADAASTWVLGYEDIQGSAFVGSCSVWDYYGMAGWEPVEHQFYYPGNLFPKYFTSASLIYPDETYYYTLGNVPTAATEFKKLNVDVAQFSIGSNTLTLNTTGNYDVGILQGNLIEGSKYCWWSITVNESNNAQIPFPQIPTQILDLYGIPHPDKWTFDRILFQDFTGFNGYKDLFDFGNQTPRVDYLSIHNECLGKTIYFPSAGGRGSKNRSELESKRQMQSVLKSLGIETHDPLQERENKSK